MKPLGRVTLGVAGLLGASGVAAAAASSHAGAALLAPLALIALTHAPVLVALALHGPIGALGSAPQLLLAVGAVLFCIDLATRYFLGTGLFPLSAPLGGGVMILGWLALAASAVFHR
jgi:uncharacterized membrane protein YgdD (TMEM256/DUF423 family)